MVYSPDAAPPILRETFAPRFGRGNPFSGTVPAQYSVKLLSGAARQSESDVVRGYPMSSVRGRVLAFLETRKFGKKLEKGLAVRDTRRANSEVW